MDRDDVRLSLPSKGRLGQETLDFLDACALKVYRPNPRQYVIGLPSGRTTFRPNIILPGVAPYRPRKNVWYAH